jgi:hypothetical protein
MIYNSKEMATSDSPMSVGFEREEIKFITTTPNPF